MLLTNSMREIFYCNLYIRHILVHSTLNVIYTIRHACFPLRSSRKINKEGGCTIALRFRKSFKIGKGLRLNVSKRGVGMSAGKNGLRKSIHSTGSSTSSIGIPGTGLSYRKQSSLKKAKQLRNKQSTAPGSTRQGNN